MHGLAVETRPVVVELIAVAEIALHAESVRSLKPPWYSYDAVITRNASRVARSVSLSDTASASGLPSSASTRSSV